MRSILLKTLIFALFFTTLSISSYAESDRFHDRFIVHFNDSMDEIVPRSTPDGWNFGITGLDLVCQNLGVNTIEKMFKDKNNPEIWTLIDLDKIFVLHFPPEADMTSAIEEFNRHPAVMYAEPYFIRKMDFTPNDPYFYNQWGLDNTQAELAWDYAQGDGSVTISIVDSGMDMDHPDLSGNLWVNPGEDLNGNGVIDLIEWNAVDDDGNGFIDDFYGWDLMDNDNNPDDDPQSGHGTHCSGIASAQTNNNTGIASLGFDCSLIPVRTGSGQYIYYGYQGISYAISVDADIMSLSWGGGGFSMLEQQLFDQAYANGIAVFGAAGNDNSSALHYPSGYEHVMAVASTNQSDIKSRFSNYGDWIGISAPGSSIFSTYLNGQYTSMSGTSMACPFTASLAGLIKSAFPSFEAQDIYDAITETADNIDNLNPNYIGLLGAGRINAFQAMGMLNYPDLTMGDYIITDDGNNNGRPDPGENVELTVELINSPNWQTAASIQAFLTCFEDGIDVTVNAVNYPDLPGGQTISNTGDPFEFTVSPDFVPEYVTFYYDILCQPDNYIMSDSITILIGTPQILLVDDDYNGAFEAFYLEPLNAINASYEYWDNNASYMLQDQIDSYEIVIWFTGNSQLPLDAYEQSLLGNYMDQGGRLFLSGQYIGDDIGSTAFYSDYLHASVEDPAVTMASLDGAEGHELSGGSSLLLVGGTGAGNGLESPSAIIPDTQAQPLYYYNDLSGVTDQIGGISYAGEDYRLVYFEFAFEAISGMGTPEPTTNRAELLEMIITWLQSESSVELTSTESPGEFTLYPNYPNPFNPVTEIAFSIPKAMQVELKVYDILGREAASLVSGSLNAGLHTYTLNAENLASGIYFASLETAEKSQMIKMMLIK